MASQSGSLISRQAPLVKALLIAPFCAAVLAIHHFAFARAPERFDFASAFYVAAQMLRHGLGRQLFDLSLQRAFQMHYLHALGGAFYSPPVVALLYWPTALFGVTGGHFLWSLVSLAILFLSSMVLHRALKLGPDALTIFAITFLFVPVHIQLLQGQVDILVLLVLSLALTAMQKRQDFLAGAVLALGLIKFQFILPLAVVFLLRRRWRLLAGFGVGSSLFVAVCAAISGWGVVLNYPRVLLQLSASPNAGINQWMMPNLRGLFFVLAHHEAPMAVLAGGSLLLLLLGAYARKSLEQGFALAVVVSVLASYHLNPHSLIFLLLPLAVLVKFGARSSSLAFSLCLLGGSVIMLPALVLHRFALITIPIGVLAWAISRPVPKLEGRYQPASEASAVEHPSVSAAS
ncbi:MAG TPA: glycosyltransferase family 87 protein [Candidatus Sulfotelmatobacter sp.]|nr:glycosyltransferase family 87 protein [Candidatus Sulfotelmatobacter sp.]